MSLTKFFIGIKRRHNLVKVVEIWYSSLIWFTKEKNNMNVNFTFLIMLVGMFALMFFMQRSQKKQAEKRMESLNKLQKGYEVITIGGLYGTVDEVNTENRTIVLDVDGVYLTFELAAIRTVLPVKEAVTPEGAVIEDGSAIEE
jgi:preprotein translocase, yajC subunit